MHIMKRTIPVCHGPESCQMDSLFPLAIAMLLHGHQKIPLQFVTPVCRTRPKANKEACKALA